MYDGDTAQVLETAAWLVHPSACLCAAARCGAGVCHLATMTGNMSSARKCPGCSWLNASYGCCCKSCTGPQTLPGEV